MGKYNEIFKTAFDENEEVVTKDNVNRGNYKEYERQHFEQIAKDLVELKEKTEEIRSRCGGYGSLGHYLDRMGSEITQIINEMLNEINEEYY